MQSQKEILESIYNKVSVKEQISSTVVKSIVEDTFAKVRTDMSSDVYPTILIRNFIRFIPRLYKIENKLETYLNNIIDKDYKSFDNMITKINSYKRLCKENDREPLRSILELEERLLDKIKLKNNEF